MLTLQKPTASDSHEVCILRLRQNNMSMCFIPLTPYFYIIKLGFTEVCIIFNFCSKTYSVPTIYEGHKLSPETRRIFETTLKPTIKS